METAHLFIAVIENIKELIVLALFLFSKRLQQQSLQLKISDCTEYERIQSYQHILL